MARRKRIALIFGVNKDWMGGTYYVLNIIEALNTLPEDEKPEIILLCKSESDYRYAEEYTGYPHLTFRIKRSAGIAKRMVNKAFRMLTGHNVFPLSKFGEKVDAVYPIFNSYDIKSPSPRLAWIPDFQERHLPHLFTEQELRIRDRRIRGLVSAGLPVVFSSFDALGDFERLYDADGIRTHVFHFASRIPDVPEDASSVLAKYCVKKGDYFFCANQFWTHKNHRVLFEAVKILKDEGIEITLLCSGGTNDYRNPDYFPSLEKYIEKNGLTENIRLLGMIDRNEQLSLMKDSRAVIQPSLFEGWSTSIEEAKSLDKFMILSDLPLHKEQVTRNALFFSRNDAAELADRIRRIAERRPDIVPNDYGASIAEAGRRFMEIVSELNAE